MMQDSRAGGLINPITLRKMVRFMRCAEVYAPYRYLITGLEKCDSEGPGRSHMHARAQQRT